MATQIGAAPARPSPFAVLRRRNFALLWLAQFISTIGNGLITIAASLLVYRQTGSALSVGLMLMASALPTLFVGLFAGVIVDRSDRKRIMIAADLLRALLVVSIPLLLPFGIAWLYMAVVLTGAVSQFFEPAQASVLPELADDQELAAANSMMTISQIGALTVGYAGAGLIATLGSIDLAFYLNALTFVVSALCIAFVRVAPLALTGETSAATVLGHLRDGLACVRDTPILRSLFLIFVPIFLLFGVNNALMLPFATRALQGSEFEYSLLEGLFTVGFVVASMLLAGYIDRLHEGQWIAISIIGMGVMAVVFALARALPVALALTFVYGIFNAPSYIGRSLVIQRSTVREVRGRVNSAFFVIRDLAFMLGMLIAGLADLVDVRLLLLANSLLLLGCGLIALRLPGLGQPTAEWRRLAVMLRTAPAAPGLGLGRAAQPGDIEMLALRLPAFAALDTNARQAFAAQTRVFDAPEGAALVRQGEVSDVAYIVLDGRTVVSRREDETDRVLEVLSAGDFFGEIAALTSVPRTATVLVEESARVLQVPAATLRQLMADPGINRAFLSKLTERVVRMSLVDLPRLAGFDQTTLRELRLPDPAHAAPAVPVAG